MGRGGGGGGSGMRGISLLTWCSKRRPTVCGPEPLLLCGHVCQSDEDAS